MSQFEAYLPVLCGPTIDGFLLKSLPHEFLHSTLSPSQITPGDRLAFCRQTPDRGGPTTTTYIWRDTSASAPHCTSPPLCQFASSQLRPPSSSPSSSSPLRGPPPPPCRTGDVNLCGRCGAIALSLPSDALNHRSAGLGRAPDNNPPSTTATKLATHLAMDLATTSSREGCCNLWTMGPWGAQQATGDKGWGRRLCSFKLKS